MNLTIRNLNADELETVVGGDIQHGLGSGEETCTRWFENENGITTLVLIGTCFGFYGLA